MKKGLLFVSLLFAFTQCGNQTAKGQVIPGTEDITIERCNEILNVIGDTNDRKFFSKELGELSDEFDRVSSNEKLLDTMLGTIGGGYEIMSYWLPDDGYGTFDEKEIAQVTYTLVSSSENKADLLLNTERANCAYHMILVKENGQWMLDDWVNFDYSIKQELKDYNDEQKELVYVHYEGYLEEAFDPQPFKAFFAINKKKSHDGKQTILGAIRFDNKEDEYYDEFEGMLDKDRSINFEFRPDEDSEYYFWGSITPDYKTITGELQVYALALEGRMVYCREFIMKAME